MRAPSSSLIDSSAEETEENTAAVVYFSVTNHTEAIAGEIAQIIDTDIYEIIPGQAYTEEDLDYNDDSCRPAISTDLSIIMQYDTIYPGYPIWWSTHPGIIQAFLTSKKMIRP